MAKAERASGTPARLRMVPASLKSPHFFYRIKAPSFEKKDVDLVVRAAQAYVIQNGIGVALLPRHQAARLAEVVAVRPAAVGAKDPGPTPTRDLWMVVHRSKQRVPKVRAVMDWVEQVFAEARPQRKRLRP